MVNTGYRDVGLVLEATCALMYYWSFNVCEQVLLRPLKGPTSVW